MKKFNKSAIMKYAWQLFKSQAIRTDEMFSICLKNSWLIAKNSIIPDFNTIYKDNYKSIYTFIYNMVRNIEISEELTNDVFMKSTNYLYNNEKKTTLSSWLHSIAKNIVVDYCRKEKLDKHINMSNIVDNNENECYQFVDSFKTESMVENNELKTSITNAFDNLTTKYKRVAELFFIDDMPYNEIAIVCEIPLNTVKGMLFRVRKLLQIDLQHEYKSI